ncbi:MAG: gluconate 2-dehydrogenase subunit 3 family protein [Xanthomonadaceae bacterium]|jgi:gluconate 2-dehydrogenase gamma chain|nr:gluconate 2-dehydrogenase subunit 3 family protein [Xanthomonadaceae bacterium]
MTNSDSPSARREFLRKSVMMIPAVAVTMLPGCDSARPPAAASEAARYEPGFFSAPEWAFMQAAVARLIPADERGPGAVEAGVPEFIDRQLQTVYGSGGLWFMQGPFHPDAPAELGYQGRLSPQEIYRFGIRATDESCRQRYGKPFPELDQADQDSVLTELDTGTVEWGALPAPLFFNLLLTNAKEGFFSDPIHGGNRDMVGWTLIGFPGARADFMDWVERDERYPFPPVSIRGKRA